jgi:putative transposase
MRRFKSAGHVQRFLSAHGPILSHFRPRRPRLTAREYRQEMAHRRQVWREITIAEAAA